MDPYYDEAEPEPEFEVQPEAEAEEHVASPWSPDVSLEHGSVSLEFNEVVVPERTALRALVWNIQDLGGGPSRPGATRPNPVKDAIAALIWQCRADFVGLLELKRSGPRPRRPVRPLAAAQTRLNPFVDRFGRRETVESPDFEAGVSNFVYRLVNEVIWDPVLEALDGAEEPELTLADLGEHDQLEEASGESEEDPVTACLPELGLSSHSSWGAITAALTAPKFGLVARVQGLFANVLAVAQQGVEDWSAAPLDRRLAWPKNPEPVVEHLRTKCKKGSEGSFALGVEQAFQRIVIKARGPRAKLADPDPVVTALVWELAEVRRQAAWVNAMLEVPLPEGEDDAAVWKELQQLGATLAILDAQIVAAQSHCALLWKVSTDVLRPVADAVAVAVGLSSGGWKGVTDQNLMIALQRGALAIRNARYEAAQKRYQEQLDAQQSSGTYPGLLEFLYIAEAVCGLAGDEDSEGFEYGVWPPLKDLRALAQECAEAASSEESSSVRGPAAERCSKYFTADEAYGILYNKRLFVGPRDPLPDSQPYALRPRFLPSYSKRAPLVVPLRVRRLGVDVRFVLWHAPAPSSGNAEIRAVDFPQLEAHAGVFRKRGQLAIFLSDTNVDTRPEMLDSAVEHWRGTGSAPARRAWLCGLTGDAEIFGREDLITTMATSLVRSKLVDVGGRRFAYHNAAYDKAVLLCWQGVRGATLDYEQQQIISPARAILPPREPVAEDVDPPQTPIWHPPSPLIHVSRTLGEGLAGPLRHAPVSMQPRDQAQQLVDDAHAFSDHEGVLADFRLTGFTMPAPDLSPLIEQFKQAMSEGSGVRETMDEILRSLGGGGGSVDEEALGQELASAFPEHAEELRVIAEPEATQPVSLAELQRILREALGSLGVAPREARPTARDAFTAFGLTVIPNLGAGPCLFYSACDLRYGAPSTFATGYGMRVRALAHLRGILAGEIDVPVGMRGSLDELLQWHAAGFGGYAAYAGDWPTYLAEMAKPHAWGDLIILSAMSHMLDQAYHVFVQAGDACWEDDVVFGGTLDEPHNLYCQNQFHWEALTPGEAAPVLEHPAEHEAPPPPKSSSGPSVSFPFDTSGTVVLWDTSNKSYWWSPGNVTSWGVGGWLFVFGDNCQRNGMGGQANIRGQAYATGLRTCKQPPGGMSNAHTFHFVDAEIDQNKKWIEEDLQRIAKQAAFVPKVVIPYDTVGKRFDLGTNLAKMDVLAPLTFAWMQLRLQQFVLDLQGASSSSSHMGSSLPPPPPPSSGEGEEPFGEEEDPAPSSGKPPPKPKRKAPEPSSQGPYKRGATEEDSVQVQLRSLFGVGSGASGFGHVDVGSVPNEEDVFSLTVRRFPPHVGEVPLEDEEGSIQRLLEQFQQERVELRSALNNPEVSRLEVQPAWGGMVMPELGEDPEIQEELDELLRVAKRHKGEEHDEQEHAEELPEPLGADLPPFHFEPPPFHFEAPPADPHAGVPDLMLGVEEEEPDSLEALLAQELFWLPPDNSGGGGFG